MPCFWVRRSAVIDNSHDELQGHCCLGPTWGNTGHSKLCTELKLHPLPLITTACYKEFATAVNKALETQANGTELHISNIHTQSQTDPPFSNLDNLTAGNPEEKTGI